MTEELRRKLAALRAAAPALNKATDEASAVVAAVEKFLADLSIGLTLKTGSFHSVPAPGDEDDEERTVFHSLAYGRVGGTYRIHVAAETCRKDEDFIGGWDVLSTEETPWTSCPREMKLQSFAKLPELLGLLADRALKLSEDTTRTTETVRDLLAAMEPDDLDPRAGSNVGVGDKAWEDAGRRETGHVTVISEEPASFRLGRKSDAMRQAEEMHARRVKAAAVATMKKKAKARRPLMVAAAEIVKLNGGPGVLEDPDEGAYIRIDHPNAPTFLPLTIEVNGTGPRGWPLVDVAHYRETNGDMVPDPLVQFEVPPGEWESGRWEPVAMTTSMGFRSIACRQDAEGKPVVDEKAAADIREYAEGMDGNIRDRFLGLARQRARDGIPVSDTAGEED